MPTAKKEASRRGARRAARFSVMVAGQAGLGKSTLLATLFDPFVAPAVVKGTEEARTRIFAPTAAITTFTFEMEPEPGTNLIVEAIDTPGYGDEVSAVEQADRVRLHLEGTFGDVFEEEQRIHRNPKFEEHRVHALLYLLEPTSLGLKLFDVDFMKRLDERVNIIPVLAKADGLPREEREAVKRLVMGDIAKHGIRIFDFSPCAALDHEGGGEVNINALLPFAAIGSTFPHAGGDAPRRGRQYATGFVSVDDAKSCDTALLLKILLTSARDELKEETEDSLYEAYRTDRLLASAARAPSSAPDALTAGRP